MKNLIKNNKISLYNSFLQMTQDRARMESDTTAEINKAMREEFEKNKEKLNLD